MSHAHPPVEGRSKFHVIAWIAVLAALLPFAPGLEGRLSARAEVNGSTSQLVDKRAAAEFKSPWVSPLIAVAHGVDARTAAGAAALGALRDALQADGARTLTYLDRGDPLLLGADGKTALIAVEGGRDPRAASASFLRQHPRVSLSWTGDRLINDDIRALSARDANAAEALAAPLALIVLVLAFGSLSAGLTPLVMGALAVVLARGALALIAQFVPLSVLSANVASMLGLGLSIDYALLVVSRFREGLAKGDAKLALRQASDAVMLSGFGLSLALSALLLVPVNEVRAIALAGLCVCASAVAVCAGLLPPLLMRFGGKLDVLLPVRRKLDDASARLWRRWVEVIFTRPLLCTIVSAAPLLALALNAQRLDITLPRGDWAPRSLASVSAMHDLERAGRGGLLQSALVIVDLKARADTPEGWAALRAADAALAEARDVAATRSVVSVFGNDPQGWRAIDRLDAQTRAAFLNADGTSALVSVVPREGLSLGALTAWVRHLRSLPAPPGVTAITIGGASAVSADYVSAVQLWFLPIAGVVIAASFAALACGLKSLVLPLKAVALNALSVAASLGALTLVFQDGVAAGLIGIPQAYGAVFPIVPILSFAIVFGLSMDYEVFLFSRVVDAHRAGADNRRAMSDALAATGGVITSAALLMIIVFGAFLHSKFLLMKMLGFALAFAIFIDAFVIRVALGPALFALAGRWNWLWLNDYLKARRHGADQRRSARSHLLARKADLHNSSQP